MEQEKNFVHDGCYLSINERKIIETGCRNGSTKTAIAKTIGKEKSTIGKEIKQHRFISIKCPLPMECKNYRHCKFGRECRSNCPIMSSSRVRGAIEVPAYATAAQIGVSVVFQSIFMMLKKHTRNMPPC